MTLIDGSCWLPKSLHSPWAKACNGNRGGMEMCWEEQ